MKYSFALMLAVFIIAVGERNASAEMRLAIIFADHMVLQREQPIQIWGWADAGDRVTVTFADQTETTDAAQDGAWSVTLKPLKTASEGRRLRVENGEQTIVVNDVLVGDVWHASGQSNMTMTVSAMASELDIVPADSYHKGGVYVLLADGSTKFISDAIDCGDLWGGTIRLGMEGDLAPGSPSRFGAWGALGTRAAND
ncbi:H-X9-DG-CTERM domain-containing protein [Novipirellula caenicola]|uniref:DUF1559 domain-containing protein n=1 Tax=Novipirellula caenicola TaxID=1536901 RepID=A0ABP9VV98_9BACT